MKKTIILAGYFIISLFLFAGISFAEAPPVEERIQPDKAIDVHRMVRINYRGAVGALIPETVTIQPGSTIVWINESKGPIEIEFEGRQVTVACKSPVHFVISEKGSFISNRIPFGAVASLCFVETGEFDYVTRRADPITGEDALKWIERGIPQIKGKIIVEPPQE